MEQTKAEHFQGILEAAIKQLKNEDMDKYEFYLFLPEEVWEESEEADEDFRSMDEYIACNAIKFPELHGLMRKLVAGITAYNNAEWPLWDQDEEHAGGAIARELALSNKEDVVLYARFVSSNDLNHEVYQSEDMCDILAKWGPCQETYALAAARWLTPGQHRYEFDYSGISEVMANKTEADAFVAMVAKWFQEEWFPPYNIDKRYDDVVELLEKVIAEPLGLDEKAIKEIIDSKIATK